jgi:hypothetical protein
MLSCGCGRLSGAHSQVALSRFTISMVVKEGNVDRTPQKWNIQEHTQTSPTDAYGVIEFQGGTHAHKAQYVRLSFDSSPSDVLYLLERVWNVKRPHLIISVNGGTSNFELVLSFWF